ncbi:hypothetical protein HU200_046072 [Digitaria exilis]|uniref:Uncharacterized protein n=1 Tax=Digitaria exilis TaxID=1010633 RepID=A0A835EBP3_9POAL|nr:hypothetical protein HU200_046072 [Digitaria exilis]
MYGTPRPAVNTQSRRIYPLRPPTPTPSHDAFPVAPLPCPGAFPAVPLSRPTHLAPAPLPHPALHTTATLISTPPEHGFGFPPSTFDGRTTEDGLNGEHVEERMMTPMNWEKLQLAAAIENPQDIIAQSPRPSIQRAVLKFAKHTGAHAIAGTGRRTPGTFTIHQPGTLKSSSSNFVQPVKESALGNIPTSAFCDTSACLRGIKIM